MTKIGSRIIAILSACLFMSSVYAAPATPVDDLQLDLVPVTHTDPADKGKPMVVFFTGDGGWAELDKRESTRLMKAGMPVVGWSTLTYYWHFKSPEQTAKDLERILAYYTKTWQRSRVILIGYSFGSEVFPFAINLLAPEYRKMIVGGVMLVPSTSSDFEIHVSDWVSSGNLGKYPTLPELQKIRDIPLLCLYSEPEDDDLCPLLKDQSNVKLVQLSGGHNFGKQYSLVFKHIMQTMAPVIAPSKN